MADYRRLFKHNGTLRVVERPKNRPYHRKTQTNKPAVADASIATESAAPAASAPEDVSAVKPETKNAPYPLETRRIGVTALFVEVAKQTGLWEDFSKTWGRDGVFCCLSQADHRAQCGLPVQVLVNQLCASFPSLHRRQ